MRMQNKTRVSGMKKSQILVARYLVTLIVAIVLFIAAFVFAGKLFRLTDTSQRDFFEFQERLEGATSAVDSYPVRMDKGTAIIFFNYGDIIANFNYQGGPGVIDATYTIKKPLQCGKDPCMCYCKDFDIEDFGTICLSPKCKNLGFEFTGSCSDNKKCENGVMVTRDFLYYSGEPSRAVVYFRKEDGKLGIYHSNPDVKKIEPSP